MQLSLATIALLFATVSLGNPLGNPVPRAVTTTSTSSAAPTQTGIVCNCNTYYTVVSGDTCSGIVTKYNNAFTLNQFYSWNPAVGSSCANLWVGYGVCVGVNTAKTCTTSTTASTTSTALSTTSTAKSTTSSSSSVKSTTTSTTTVKSTSTASSSASCAVTATNIGPSPEQTGIAWNCNAYYEVVSGDSCSGIVSKYNNFTLSQFYTWNPAVNTTCSSLLLGYYVCIGVNTTQKVSCAPTTTSTSLVSSSSWNPSTTGTWWYISSVQIDPQASPSIYPSLGAPSAVQAGIQQGCQAYYQAAAGDNCTSITDYFFGFDESQFVSWNPAVGSTCSNLVVGDYYCVQPSSYNPGPPVYAVVNNTNPSTLPNCVIQNCSAWYLAQLNDTCTTVPSTFGYNFTYSEFMNWNPSINWSNCTGFEANQYYCVNWPGAAQLPYYSNISYYDNSTNATFYDYPNTTCTTATSTPSATTTGSTSVTSTVSVTSTGAPQPEQSGVVSNCNKYYLVGSGDSCGSIELAYNISSAQFLTWNTGINSQCTNLWSGYYCCVGVPGSSSVSSSVATTVSTTKSSSTTTTSIPTTTTSKASTTTTSKASTTTTSSAAPSPTQSGLAANCNSFYDVVSGDTCSGIVTKYNNAFTLTQFYSWNPALGSSCASLWVGYYVCVGVPTSTSTTTTSKATTTTSTKASSTTTTTN